MKVRAPWLRAISATSCSPARRATARFSSAVAGTSLAPNGDSPIRVIASAIVLAVNCPPHAPAPGQAARSSSHSSFSSSLPAAQAPTASKTSWMVTSRSCQRPGCDRPPVEQERGQIEARHGHRRARDGLVAAGQPDHAVDQMAQRRQLHRVGDDFARHQRRFHAVGAHGDAVTHGDGVELHRRRSGGAHPRAHLLGQVAQVQVARHDVGPGGDDGDERLFQLGVAEAGGAQHGPRRRSRESLLQRIATQRNLQLSTKKKPPLRFTRAGAESGFRGLVKSAARTWRRCRQ